jgi:predicted HTH transcriptional regulator
MLKSAYGEEMYLHKRSKQGESRYKTMNGKDLSSTSRTEEWTEVIQKYLAKDRTLTVWMIEEMAGISRETVHKILVEDLKKKKVCSFCTSFVNTRSKMSALHHLLNFF